MLALQSLIQTRETPHQSQMPHPVPRCRAGAVCCKRCARSHFHFSLRTLILWSVKPLKGFLSRLTYSSLPFWLNATWAMVTNAASYHNVTILVSRFIFHAHWPVGHSSPLPLLTALPENAALLCFYIRSNRQVNVNSLSNCKYYLPYTFVKAWTYNLTKVPGRIWNCCTVWWKNYCCYESWLGYIALDKRV